MTAPRIPPAPRGTRASGRALWTAVLGRFELEQHELALLGEAVRTVDLLDTLAAVVERDGAVLTGPDGLPRVHPAVVEARQGRLALTRVLAALRLPDEAAGGKRPQHRGGARVPYGVRSA